MSAGRTHATGFYGWINVATASIIGVVGGFYLISFGYLLPYLVRDFGWNRGDVSWAATINMIAMGICGPIAGFFIVKYGARRSILFGNLLGLAGFLVIFIHTRLWELFLGYGLLIGVGAGFGGMLATTTIINNWFVKKRGLALSIFLGSGGAAGMFMGPAIMEMIERAGWRMTVLTMSGFVLLFAIISPAIFIKNKPEDLGQVPDGPEGSDPSGGSKPMPPKAAYRTSVDFSAAEAMRTKSFWLLIAYFCLNMLAMGALMTHQVAYLMDIGVKATLAGFALSVMSAMMTLSQFSVGYFGKKFSMHSIAIGGECFKVLGLAILLLTSSLPFVFVYMVVLGMGFGAAMAATFNIFPNYFGISSYPKIMGTARLFWAFVGGAGAPLAGYVRDTVGSYLPAFRVAILVVILGLVFLFFAKAPVHPKLKGESATH
ncbi:MAG: MFS transporter [Acidobacteria bacterium]|nr:MFS transporter [Acidobacteriota bacterium]